MPLNLPSSDQGNRVPIIKYDARAGRLFRVDRSDASGRWEGSTVEIPSHVFQAVFDLGNIETGWLHFPTGGAPDIRVAKVGSGLPDRPSEKHRPGYRLLLLLGKQSGGDLREMAANAKVSVDAMKLLFDQYEAGAAQNPGLLPVVKLVSTIPRVSQGKANGQAVSSTNYEPVWQIVKWVPRPPELEPGYVQQALQQQAAQPPPPASPPVQVAPPVAAPPPQPLVAPPPPLAPQPQPQLATVDDDF